MKNKTASHLKMFGNVIFVLGCIASFLLLIQTKEIEYGFYYKYTENEWTIQSLFNGLAMLTATFASSLTFFGMSEIVEKLHCINGKINNDLVNENKEIDDVEEANKADENDVTES